MFNRYNHLRHKRNETVSTKIIPRNISETKTDNDNKRTIKNIIYVQIDEQ